MGQSSYCQLAIRGIDVIGGRLLSDARNQFAHAVGEAHAGLVAEHTADLRDVGIAMADITGAILVHDFRFALHPDFLRQCTGYVHDGEWRPGADIEYIVLDRVGMEREEDSPHNVAHMDEVPALATILKN